MTEPEPEFEPEPVYLAHNGFHLDADRDGWAHPVVDVEESHGRHRLSDGTAPHRPRHYREDDEGADDDAETYGRHALAGRSRLSGADLALP